MTNWSTEAREIPGLGFKSLWPHFYSIFDIFISSFTRVLNIFSSREEGIEAIKERLLYDFSLEDEDENELYYVFFDDEDVEEKNIVGMFNGGKGVTHSYYRYSLSLFKHLKFSQALGLAKVNFLDSFVLVDVEPEDFYICELAVLSSYRGRGCVKPLNMGCKF